MEKAGSLIQVVPIEAKWHHDIGAELGMTEGRGFHIPMMT